MLFWKCTKKLYKNNFFCWVHFSWKKCWGHALENNALFYNLFIKMKILLQLIQMFFGLKLASYVVDENGGWNSDDENSDGNNSDENNSWNSDENNSNSSDKNSWEQSSYEKWKNMTERKKQEEEDKKNNDNQNNNQNNDNQNNNQNNQNNSEKKFSAEDVQELIKQEFQNRDNINNQKQSFFNEVDEAANALSEYWLENDKEKFKNLAIDRDKNGLKADDVFILANKDLIFEKLWGIPKAPMSSDSWAKHTQQKGKTNMSDFVKNLRSKLS